MQVELREVVRISGARRWFQDPDFIAWINAPGVATWHTKGEEPGEYSDVFLHVCGEDGTDTPGYGFPAPSESSWKEIIDLVRETCGEGAEVLVWISNEEE